MIWESKYQKVSRCDLPAANAWRMLYWSQLWLFRVFNPFFYQFLSQSIQAGVVAVLTPLETTFVSHHNKL